jgi:Rhodanese-related sulfurtransferase
LIYAKAQAKLECMNFNLAPPANWLDELKLAVGLSLWVTFYIIMSYNVIKKNVISMSFSIIPIQDLENYLRRPGTILIDLREEEDYEQGHIKGAKNIPYERWQVEKETWTHRYDTVVFYCERGNQSMYAAREMNKKGYYAISIAGGYQGYKVWKRKETNAE